MADEAAKIFLEKHKLEHLIVPFDNAGATKAEFSYLRENLVELMALVPLLSDRRKFVEAFDAEQSSSSSARQIVNNSSTKTVSIRANLETICQSSDEGKRFWVLKDKQFDEDERVLLSRVITKYFFDVGNGSISKFMFLEMVDIIKKQFPSERSGTWFIPGIGTKKPQGKLFSSYRILQGHQCEDFGPKKGKRVIKKVTVSKQDKLKEQADKNLSDLSDEQKNACQSSKLRLNTIPYNCSNDIFECWDECFPLRRHEIMSGSFDMNEYNVLYNFGKTNELISKDFSRVNAKYLHISSKLPFFIKKFKAIFDGFRKKFKDDEKLVDEIVKTFNDVTTVNDRSIFLAFYSLPLILRENFVKCGEKRFRPTLFMTREAFITLIPTEATLAETRKTRKENAISRKVTIQPYIVAVGSVTCVSRYFVVFDELLIPCTTCMEAIDLHYKMHDSFNLQYAAECRSVMIFIQKFFYELSYEGDFLVPQVETLIGVIEK